MVVVNVPPGKGAGHGQIGADGDVEEVRPVNVTRASTYCVPSDWQRCCCPRCGARKHQDLVRHLKPDAGRGKAERIGDRSSPAVIAARSSARPARSGCPKRDVEIRR